jgi:hypothetical protein
MAQTVTRGPFCFMSRTQLDAIRVAFAADAPTYTRSLAGASVNGQSFTFSHDGVEYHREEFASLLQDAYCQIGVTTWGTPAGNRTAARFTSGDDPEGYGLENTD